MYINVIEVGWKKLNTLVAKASTYAQLLQVTPFVCVLFLLDP